MRRRNFLAIILAGLSGFRAIGKHHIGRPARKYTTATQLLEQDAEARRLWKMRMYTYNYGMSVEQFRRTTRQDARS